MFGTFADRVKPPGITAAQPPLVSDEVCGHPRSDARYASYQRRKVAAWAGSAVERETGQRQRICTCGHRHGISEFVSVNTVERPDGTARAHYSGVRMCGNVWQCPVCGGVIRGQRADELQAGVDAWRAQGGRVALLTVTVRHRLGDKLGDMLGWMGEAWRWLTSQRAYKRAIKPALGLVGYVRALEVTYGASGWHPHWHLLLFLAPERERTYGEPLTDELARVVEANLLEFWRAAVAAHGGRVPNEHGVDLRLVGAGEEGAVSDYMTKLRGGAAGAVLEVAGAASKAGRGEIPSVTPWQLLDQAREDKRAYALWREYCEGTRGRSCLRWSRGLRARLGLGVERTDEEIADEAAACGVAELVIDGRLHDGIAREPRRAVGVLRAVERGDRWRAAAIAGARWAREYVREDGSAVLVCTDDADPARLDRLAELARRSEAQAADLADMPPLRWHERDNYRRMGALCGVVFEEYVPGSFRAAG